MRRLPVYLVIDTSESMIGIALDSVHAGIKTMLAAFRQNPYSLEITYISIITFSDKAQQLCSLKDVFTFVVPDLEVSPGTALGAGLRMLNDCMSREVVRTTSEQKGDYKPIVFILTDGQPTDSWEKEASQFKRDHPGAMVYAIGCGDDVDLSVLKQLTDNTYSMEQTSVDTFAKLFVCISASIQSIGSSIGSGDKYDNNINLTEMAPEVLEKVEEVRNAPEGKQRQVFIPCKCQKTKKPYLMRYRLIDGVNYGFVSSHPLSKEFTGEQSKKLPPIQVEQLLGDSSCPYCGNTIWGKCACGALLCIPDEQLRNTCPTCGQTLDYSVGSFSTDQTMG